MPATEDKDIDLFIGSRIGSFKHIKFHTDTSKNNKKCIENLIDIKTLQKDEAITCMSWGDDKQTEILIGRKNNQIQIYNTQTRDFTESFIVDFGEGPIVGVGRCKTELLIAVRSGVVRTWSDKGLSDIKINGSLDRMRVCSDDPTIFAVGGEETDLQIWQCSQEIFKAKNLPHDSLQLRRPVWVADLAFLPNEGGRLVAVCSRHGYVRLYDSRAQRRPVCNVDFKSMAATCITPGFDERQVLVGFGRGQLHQVDLRSGRPDKGYKGSVGAVTDIAIDRNEGLIVSCSLDRHLRVHRHSTKELLFKQYLTSKLSCVLVQTESSTPLKDVTVETEIKEEDEKEEKDDLDELFEDMETIEYESRKKKLPLEDSPTKKIKEEDESADNSDEAIVKLLKSTEKKKRKMDKKKREKKAKSVYHTA